MSFKPGHVIHGRYRLRQVIGRGGMGEVWEAEDGEGVVAVKTLRAGMLQDPDITLRFEREIEIMQRLSTSSSDNLVRTICAGDTPQPYIVTELFLGLALEERLRDEHVLPASETRALVRQILLGLEAAHALGVVHRDLKPANVLVGANGAVKLVDFGVAKLMGDSMLTTEGATLGTIDYSAPEQIADASDVDERADLYAVGTIMFRAITGRTPFPAKNLARLIAMKRDLDPPPLEPATVPSALKQLVAELLARDPDARPKTAREVIDRWDAIGDFTAAEIAEIEESTSTFPRLVPR